MVLKACSWNCAHVGAGAYMASSLNRLVITRHLSGMTPTTRRVNRLIRFAKFPVSAYAALAVLGWAGKATAEPYIAVQQGLTCGQCHVNPTGGGMRNAVGNAFAQGVLPAHHIDTGDMVWTGALNSYIALGGDFRADATWNNNTAASNSLNTEQARIYLGVTAIPDRVVLYIDEQVLSLIHI